MKRNKMKLIALSSLLLMLSSSMPFMANELNFDVVEKPEVVEKESSANQGSSLNLKESYDRGISEIPLENLGKGKVTTVDVAGDIVEMQEIPGTDYKISTNYDNLKPGEYEYVGLPDGRIYRTDILEETLTQGSGEYYLQKKPTEKEIAIENDKLKYNNSVIPGAFLFERIPAKDVKITKNGKKEDVCIYVGNSGSTEYKDLVNKERSKYGLDPVIYSKDAGEGAMFRAAENVKRYVTGKQISLISHNTDLYGRNMGSENLAASYASYSPEEAYNLYNREKAFLPDNFDPYKDDYSSSYGHYFLEVRPNTGVVAQGAAYPDYGCDGTRNGAIVYANFFNGAISDVKLSGYQLEFNVWPSIEDVAIANTTK